MRNENLPLLRQHILTTPHKIQSFNFNTYESAVLEAIKYSKKYSTSWFVKLLEDGYYAYAHGDDTPATVACFYCGRDWTEV